MPRPLWSPRNFQSRKSVLEYDDVMNKQREIIYQQRREVLDGKDLKDTILNMTRTTIANHVAMAFGENQSLDAAGCREMLRGLEGLYFPKDTFQFTEDDAAEKSQQDFTDLFVEAAEKTYEAKEAEIGEPLMRELERVIMLRVVDEYWMDHIDAMDDLKQGIRLRAYANTDPCHRLQAGVPDHVRGDGLRHPERDGPPHVLRPAEEGRRGQAGTGGQGHGGKTWAATAPPPKKQPVKVTKIGRNDPCPCGSGLKWKKCTCKEYHDN